MRSRQLTFCAAVAACAVTTAPAYAGDERGAGSVLVSRAPAAPGDAVTLHVTGCDTERATARSSAFAAPAPLARTAGALTGDARISADAPPGAHSVTVACPGAHGRTAPTTGTVTVGAPAAGQPIGGTPTADPAPGGGQATSGHELSSTSAVGLVLAGGAVLVIAGQLLRLRLRIRRERQGGGDGR
ncbi:hypothetical protein [Streptomyces sp. NPDC101393]|uniref:hypothetical protein n=1 Tax=Streptomyces sp. NPDC101393 TaxID=3366141 RepID=UPI00381492DB